MKQDKVRWVKIYNYVIQNNKKVEIRFVAGCYLETLTYVIGSIFQNLNLEDMIIYEMSDDLYNQEDLITVMKNSKFELVFKHLFFRFTEISEIIYMIMNRKIISKPHQMYKYTKTVLYKII